MAYLYHNDDIVELNSLLQVRYQVFSGLHFIEKVHEVAVSLFRQLFEFLEIVFQPFGIFTCLQNSESFSSIKKTKITRAEYHLLEEEEIGSLYPR